MHRLFDGPPPRGLVQLIITLALCGFYFFGTPKPRYQPAIVSFWGPREPSFFEQMRSGSPSDFVVLFTLGLIILIVYSIAVAIVDYRKTGRLW